MEDNKNKSKLFTYLIAFFILIFSVFMYLINTLTKAL